MHVYIVIYGRPIHPFRDIVLFTTELYAIHTTTNHPIATIQASSYHFEKSSQEYD